MLKISVLAHHVPKYMFATNVGIYIYNVQNKQKHQIVEINV